MPTLSYGLNIVKKRSAGTEIPPPKRKPIFNDDSGSEDDPNDEETTEAISTIGGLQPPASKLSSTKASHSVPSSRSKKPPKISQYGDLSTNHSTNKHSKNAQELDPNIYDYDSFYDSVHAKAPASTSTADVEKKPKYMGSLLAAAEVRKRDELRAKEKMLAKEREMEGDEFADKEKFVTGAYKRQQEEMRKLEEEEALRERQAEERKKRQGGGMKAFHQQMLERDERRHQEVLKVAEEGKGKTTGKSDEEPPKKEKSEAELAKAKGAVVNEEGEVVDKRQLLQSGLNAGSAPKAKAPSKAKPKDSARGRRLGESARERETREFEEQLLGKRSASEDSDDQGGRAGKSRKLEDELLGLGIP